MPTSQERKSHMRTQEITAQRMAKAGVSFFDVLWYFSVARPRGFSAPGDAARARAILLKTCAVKH